MGSLAGRLDRPELPAPPSLEPFFDHNQTLFLGTISSPLDFYPDKSRLTVQLQAVLEGVQNGRWQEGRSSAWGRRR